MIYKGKDDKEGSIWDPTKTYLDKPKKPFEVDGRLFAFNLRTVKNKKISDIYKTLLKDDCVELQLLIEFNFLENESTVLKQIPRITSSKQIGNGFEIFDMKLAPPEIDVAEDELESNEMPLDQYLM